MDVNSLKPVVDIEPTRATPVVTGQSSYKRDPQAGNSQGMVADQKATNEKIEEKLSEAVDKLNKTAVIFDRSLRFQVHDKTHRTMVSVVDITSDKVIRQIPSEEVLDLVAKMDDYLGLIFDKKA